MLAEEVRGKIEGILLERGFRLAPQNASVDDIDLVVLAAFGIGDPTTVHAGTAVFPWAGMVFAVPRTATTHLRWLSVGVVRPRDMANREPDGEIPWIWYATTFSAGTSGDLRRVVDFMLIPTFEWVGRNTGQQIHVTINEHDQRIRALRQARPDG
jgi:hypothetical protein